MGGINNVPVQACMVFVLMAGCGANTDVVGDESAAPPLSYVGSAECEECHASIYSDWRTTLHSFSVRSAHDAATAAYPLPPGTESSALGWGDISYVFGGRQRIAYLDTHGQLVQPSFDVRLQRWDRQFPDGDISSCAPCHFTGAPDPERSHWNELTIGCESCHGPASRHVTTFAKQDIRVDTSSRACGACHTTIGRALPIADNHPTHDLVQVWHRDPHARGLSQHSMSAHCATCHDPVNGIYGPYDNPARLVFKEAKTDISCTSCHDPHRSTNPVYRRDGPPVAPPVMSLLHRHSGRDGDFTSSDHETVADTETQCRSCHRGADRIELNHGNASCVDCHNAFLRSRSRDTLVLHDANQTALNCRTCHDDADHLVTLLFEDPDFLEPRLIHDLEALPPVVVEHHGLRRAMTVVARPVSDDVQEVEQQLRVAVPPLPAPATSNERPDPLALQLAAATEGLAQSDPTRVQDALTALCFLDSNDVLLSLGVLPHHSAVELDRLARDIETLNAADILVAPAERYCLQALAAMTSHRPSAVVRAVAEIPADARGDLVDALGALGHLERRDARSAVVLLQAKLNGEGPHPLLRTIAAFAQARRKRLDDAYGHLQQVLNAEPGNAVAWLVHGQLAADSGNFADAAQAYLQAVQLWPDWQDASLLLGRSLIFNQQPNEALNVLKHAADSWPASFDTRYRLGSLFKLLSDQLRHQVARASENRPPADLARRDWQSLLDAYETRARDIAELAYGEYVYALAQKPGDQRTVWQIAEALRVLGRYVEARDLFASLGERHPGEWLYPYRGAVVNLAEDRLPEAIELLRKAYARRPDQADVLAALGFALLRAGRSAEAVAQIEKANAFEPFNPAAFNNLGVARARLDDLAGAERAFRRGLELRTFPLPRTHLLHTNLALVLAKSGRHSEAMAAAKRALYVFPEFAPAAHLLAELKAGDSVSIEHQINDQLELFGELSTVSPLDLTL